MLSPEQDARTAEEELKKIIGMVDNATDQSMSKLIDTLLSDSNLEGKSELNSNQIVAFARASWFAQHYDSKAMRVVIMYLLKYLISKNRGGRKEVVDALTGAFKMTMEKAKEKVEL